jgi:hypothetical protein
MMFLRLGSFGRSAKILPLASFGHHLSLGSFGQISPFGSFGQNLRWVRLAKPPWIRSAKIGFTVSGMSVALIRRALAERRPAPASFNAFGRRQPHPES